MHVCEQRQTEGLLQQDLPRRARKQVGAPDYVQNALLGVVDDDGELVCEQAIAAPQYEIPDAPGDVGDLQALEAVHELYVPVRHAEPQGCFCRRTTARRQALRRMEQLVARVGAQVFRQGGQRRPGAGAVPELAICCKAVERGAIGIEPRALPQHRAIPVQSESVQRGEDVVRGAGLLAGRIEVLDPEQPFALARTGFKPARARRDQRSEVQWPAR